MKNAFFMERETIYSRFKDMASKHPHNPAIIEEGRTLSYAQLDEMADSIMSLFYYSAPSTVGIVMSHGVTIIDGFPYLLAEMNRLESIPPSVKLIISGGDVIRGSYISNLRGKNVKIYNTYGPSETTVCSNYFRIDNTEPLDDGTFPIGKAVKGVKVKIMDRNLREVPQGETGEICIYGEGVSRGYLGKRVEPEEVENALNSCPCVERGAVRAFIDDNGLHYLTAYIIPKANCHLHMVRKWLSARLAEFMVPEFFVKINQIPITRRGKVDVAALPVVMKEGGV